MGKLKARGVPNSTYLAVNSSKVSSWWSEEYDLTLCWKVGLTIGVNLITLEILGVWTANLDLNAERMVDDIMLK